MSLTDEERQKLCEDLRRAAGYNNPICNAAAKEIERLAEELETVENENEHHMRLAFMDAGANPARTWKEEAERLARELDEARERLRYFDEQQIKFRVSELERKAPW